MDSLGQRGAGFSLTPTAAVLNTAPSDLSWYCSIGPLLKSALYSRIETHFDNPKLMQNCPHLGQSLLGLLRGTAVCLSDITEGEGHVLKGEVAVRWQKVGEKSKNVTSRVKQREKYDTNKNKKHLDAHSRKSDD